VSNNVPSFVHLDPKIASKKRSLHIADSSRNARGRERSGKREGREGKGKGGKEKVEELVLIPRIGCVSLRRDGSGTGSFIFHGICGKMQMRGASGNNGRGLRTLF